MTPFCGAAPSALAGCVALKKWLGCQRWQRVKASLFKGVLTANQLIGSSSRYLQGFKSSIIMFFSIPSLQTESLWNINWRPLIGKELMDISTWKQQIVELKNLSPIKSAQQMFCQTTYMTSKGADGACFMTSLKSKPPNLGVASSFLWRKTAF